MEERRKLLLTMLDAVYADSKGNMIVAIRPKAPFKPIFQVANTREVSGIVPVNEATEMADKANREWHRLRSNRWSLC